MQHQQPGTAEDLTQAGVLWMTSPDQRLEGTVAEGVKQEDMFLRFTFLGCLLLFCL